MSEANWPGKCACCGEEFDAGEDISWDEEESGWTLTEHLEERDPELAAWAKSLSEEAGS